MLFYTDRIHEIHEIRGKETVREKMDSMDLESKKAGNVDLCMPHYLVCHLKSLLRM